MNRWLFAVLCSVLLLCLACNEEGMDVSSDNFSVTFVLDGGSVADTLDYQGYQTRATAEADETAIAGACLYFANTNGVIVDAVSVDGNKVLRNFEPGTYKAYYVANCGLDDGSFSVEGTINSHVCCLDPQAGPFPMFAVKTFSVPQDKICSITAERLVSKVEIQKISIDFSQYPDYAAQTFTVDSIYLVNVAGETTLEDGIAFLPAESAWINKRGYDSSVADALLCDKVDKTVTALKPYATAHYFYCFQNNAQTDSHSSVWSARYTRLVVACTLGPRKTYYPIDITGPGNRLLRNCRYVINELVITDLGSEGPDDIITGSLPYHFSSTVQAWEGTHTVSESL